MLGPHRAAPVRGTYTGFPGTIRNGPAALRDSWFDAACARALGPASVELIIAHPRRKSESVYSLEAVEAAGSDISAFREPSLWIAATGQLAYPRLRNGHTVNGSVVDINPAIVSITNIAALSIIATRTVFRSCAVLTDALIIHNS